MLARSVGDWGRRIGGGNRKARGRMHKTKHPGNGDAMIRRDAARRGALGRRQQVRRVAQCRWREFNAVVTDRGGKLAHRRKVEFAHDGAA